MDKILRTLIALSVLAVNGCALETMSQKSEFTSFEPVDGGFKYRSHAYALEPIESADGEKWRMDILESYLRDNGVCPQGYVITSRKPVLKNQATLGDEYDVFYEGRCK